uniref:Iron-regulated ABC transporter permease protein SufD n=1 Tax=Candidatus Kentrum sp. MB TaxID=2138164 RepID=A0A451B8X5_9GAMM|nr:MAG: Iron-regulated ABC transporter permease protein SufD [Candidatus Kentron sp. MB]VFK74746.1 MAG: Iron-regulated ABC transporter permease protein SufD [Candidatus Kentron sp. MB]
MNIVDKYRTEFLSGRSRLSGPEWLRRRRNDAFQRFAKIGLPSSHQEAWKYTPIDAISERLYRPWDEKISTLPQPGDILALSLPDEAAHCLVFLNGHYVQSLSRINALPDGVIVDGLANHASAPSNTFFDALQKYLDRSLTVTSFEPSPSHALTNGFAALNGAFWSDGAFIHLTPGASIDIPIHLLFISTLDDEQIITHPRILIVAEENSAVEIIEHFTSLGEKDASHFTNVVTEVSVGAGAHVKHCKIQNEAQHALHIATLRTHQEKDSHFSSHSVSVGGRLARNDIHAVIGAEGGECILDGLYMANGRQHVDYHTRIEHAKPHGASRQRYKGVLAGKARGVFDGQVHVHPDAQHTDAKQRNENLLLSKDARVDTKPQLDIFADDVQCAHGATVGQLDKDMVFYLRARGIATDMALNLLTYGFVNEILALAPIPAIKPMLGKIVLTKLPNADMTDQMLELTP